MTDTIAASQETTLSASSSLSVGRLLWGFAAGAIALVAFHQAALYGAVDYGLIAAKPYSLEPAAITGVPQIASTALWAGLWGVVFAALQTRFPRGAGYWLAAFLFGAIVPTLIALTLVAHLKGLPLIAGGDAQRIAVIAAINGVWGLATGLIFRAVYSR